MFRKINFDKINRYSFSEVYASVKEFCAVFVQSKYSFIRAIVLSLSVVFIYHMLSSPEYTISSTIYLQSNEQAPAGGEFKATSVNATSGPDEPLTLDVGPLQLKGAARKAIADLNLNVHYFEDKWLGKDELYGEEAPINLVLISYSPRITQQTLAIKVIDKNTFVLREDGQVKAFLFDQIIQKPYATFKVTPGPAIGSGPEDLLVTFSDLNLMAEAYVEQIRFKRKHLHPDLLTISLKEEIPQRGVDFLKRMTAVYAEGYDVHKESYRTAMGVVYSSLDSIRLEIARLDILLEGYGHIRDAQEEQPEEQLPAAGAAAGREEQLQALQALQPYVHHPVSQITIIPENLELGDGMLQDLIQDYNQQQLDKLDLLRTHPENSQPIAKTNKQLAAIRQAIVQRIGIIQEDKPQGGETASATAGQKRAATEDDIAALKVERQAKKAQYNYLLERKDKLSNLLAASKHKLLTIHKPEDNIEAKSYFINYFLAFLFGLGMPLFLIKVLKW
ncbi:GumC domain-containing protein [Pontibacter beigongshangensis]|uniref:hypothetical protein n=1 Tax=Pontibacter beigongshangensis TaxID=2574733 RepID=UPI001650972A|nr:hypothetical protein [Pontibacter beigongshangensis]